jgi:hypothetical protein
MKYPNRIIKQDEMDSAIVTAIQNRLMEVGCGTFSTFGTFGPKTVAAVKLFQSTHRDQDGNALEIDGKIGSITWAALFSMEEVPVVVNSTNDLAAEAVKVARSQIGIMEKPPGSNRGPEIDEYLNCVNCPLGNFWCAGFVYWCFNQAAKNLNKTNPLFKTAGCLAHWNNSKGRKVPAKDAIDNPSLVKPGQIFILDHGGGMGHTGIIERVEGGFAHTIEGNSNTGGSRNGIGVFPLTRKIAKINKGFIEY